MEKVGAPVSGGGSPAAHAGAGLQVFACDGSAGEAASATLAQRSLRDLIPGPQPPSQPRKRKILAKLCLKMVLLSSKRSFSKN